LWWSSKQYTAINLHYLYLAGNLMLLRDEVVFGGGGAGTGNSVAFGAPPTRRFLTVFG
jgi:hypothetical protein